MGANNQIEIYPRIDEANEAQFISRIDKILDLSSISQNNRLNYLNSIKLIEEGDDKYYNFDKIQIKFNLGEIFNSITWSLNLFFKKKGSFKYEINLEVMSETLLKSMIYPDIYYDFDLILELEKLMSQISKQGHNELILFTDEASDGEFFNVIHGTKSSVNYLFDIAIIPNEINWSHDTNKYEIVEKLNDRCKFRSKHKYMKAKLTATNNM